MELGSQGEMFNILKFQAENIRCSAFKKNPTLKTYKRKLKPPVSFLMAYVIDIKVKHHISIQGEGKAVQQPWDLGSKCQDQMA